MDPLGRETPTIPPPTVLTRDDSQEFPLASGLDMPVAESTLREWTDEKHSLYLKSMEASFVNQLYESKLSNQRSHNNHIPSGQFKVLQGGSWKKINFDRPKHLNKAGESNVLAADPWVQRLRPKPHALVFVSTEEKVPSRSQPIIINGKMCGSGSNSKHFHVYRTHPSHHDAADGNTEVSDQNFDDEGKGSAPSSGCSSKRMKTLATASPSKDQVVP